MDIEAKESFINKDPNVLTSGNESVSRAIGRRATDY